MWRFASALVCVVLAGCGGGDAPTGAPAPPVAPAPSAAEPPPAADATLPRAPAGLTGALEANHERLAAAIDSWLAGEPALDAKPPRAVVLEALYQQRIYRMLRAEPRVARLVMARLRPGLRSVVRDNLEAGRSLRRLAGPLPKRPPRWRTAPGVPPQRLLRWYRQAEDRFGVDWEVLAAVNLVETGFGRLRNLSTAGARGPMQFIPSTWRAYGLGGDIDDPHDAILGAANYLHESGAPLNYRRALHAYNHSPLYVDAILRYARQMRRDSRRYYAYWSWQIFVRGRDGSDRRLTGPR